MIEKNTNNKTIAKNTVYLYINMMVTIVITLYTSRVILQVLGIDDFGIYQTVGGVVGLLSFLNAALGTGSSRFLTFELGKGNLIKLKKTFSTVLTAHFLLAAGIAIVAETVGLWFVYNKLVIPQERMSAAVIAYHISILTAIVHLLQVPYNASIISHERMSVYAYISIVDATLKLLIVYMLLMGGFDKLVLYSILICIVTFIMTSFYFLYCYLNFRETRCKITIDKPIMKEVLGYSGWNLFANSALALNNYGSVILLNMFFNPGVVTARAVANQVNMAAYHFITNFRTAATPQIVKRYACEDYEGSKFLLLSSTKYSFYLMLLLALPIFVVAQDLLQLWLGQLPPYSVIFLQLTIVCSLFQVFDSSFYTALYAKGQIRENALISPTILFVSFPIVYLMFRLKFPPETYAWLSLVCYAILAILVKPILIIRIVDYSWREIFEVFSPCLKVVISSSIVPLFLFYGKFFDESNVFVRFFLLVFISVSCVFFSVWFWGINSLEKKTILFQIKKLCHKV